LKLRIGIWLDVRIGKPSIDLLSLSRKGLTIRISGAATCTQGTMRDSLRGLRCMRVLGLALARYSRM
jgi:hypothetical protein